MRQVSSRVVEAFWHRSAIFTNMTKFLIEKQAFALWFSIYSHLCPVWWGRMKFVIFARVFVFASAVLGDNKGGIASVFSIVLDLNRHIFDTLIFLELFLAFSDRDALFNAHIASWILWVFDRNWYVAIVTVIITGCAEFALIQTWAKRIGI